MDGSGDKGNENQGQDRASNCGKYPLILFRTGQPDCDARSMTATIRPKALFDALSASYLCTMLCLLKEKVKIDLSAQYGFSVENLHGNQGIQSDQSQLSESSRSSIAALAAKIGRPVGEIKIDRSRLM